MRQGLPVVVRVLVQRGGVVLRDFDGRFEHRVGPFPEFDIEGVGDSLDILVRIVREHLTRRDRHIIQNGRMLRGRGIVV
eukprot:19904-Eustigmatos_ZCMA.PRE.1